MQSFMPFPIMPVIQSNALMLVVGHLSQLEL